MDNDGLPVFPHFDNDIFKKQLLQTAIAEIAFGKEAEQNPFRIYLYDALGRGLMATAYKDKKTLAELEELLRDVLTQLTYKDELVPTDHPLARCLCLAINGINTGFRILDSRESLIQQLEEPHAIPILRYLSEAKTYLTRSQVATAINISIPRAGHVLSDMWCSGLLLRHQALDADRRLIAYYALSPKGLEVLNG